MTRYNKTIVAVIGVLLVALPVLSDALGEDGNVTQQEWIALGIAVLTAIGVYFVPNRPPAGEPADPGMSEQHSA